MTGYAWLNVASLALGLLAWVLPGAALCRRRGTVPCALLSLSACALSLCLVVFYLGHLSDAGDWSALMDTAHAFRLAAAVLLAVTLGLNALALALRGAGARPSGKQAT